MAHITHPLVGDPVYGLPPYDSLNLGAHCGDNPDHVEENRKRLFAAGNLPSKPVWLEQVHGKDVLKLTGEPYASKRADASYSNTPGTVCAVMTADCLPVLFCNRAGTEVAAAHAGWRGLCAGVLEETVSCFADNIVAITRITLRRIASDFLLRAICLLNRSGLSRYTAKMCLSLLANLMPQNEQMPLIAIRPARFAQ